MLHLREPNLSEKGTDIVEARLEYESPVAVLVLGGWHRPQGYPFSIEFSIVCEEGTLDFHSAQRCLTLYRRSGEVEDPAVPETDGFQAELEAFVRAVKPVSPPTTAARNSPPSPAA